MVLSLLTTNPNVRKGSGSGMVKLGQGLVGVRGQGHGPNRFNSTNLPLRRVTEMTAVCLKSE